jgi:hypothetical protein
MTADIVDQLANAAITVLRRAAHRLEHDRVKIARDLAPTKRIAGRHERAGQGRIVVQDTPDHRRQRRPRLAPRAATGKQFEQQYAQRIDVGGNGRGGISELFGRRIIGGHQRDRG